MVALLLTVRSSRSHTADEYILLSEIEEAVELYYALLDGLKIEKQ